MKFPKLFGRKKKSSDEDDYEDDDFDYDDDDVAEDVEGDASPQPSPAESGEGEDYASADEDEMVDRQDDFDDDDFDDEEEDDEGGASRSRVLLVAIGGGTLAAILIIGGAAWWFLGSDSESDPSTVQNVEADDSRIVLDIAPRPRPNQGRLLPRAGQKLSATDTLNAIAAVSEGPGAGVVVTPVVLSAFGNLPAAPAGQALAKAPDSGLIENSPAGPLPRVGDDGRKPWQIYARPYEGSDADSPIAIIVTELGMSRATTEAAIKYLPAEVSLAFKPYGTGLADWVSSARQAGHEVFLELPMEPSDFPTQDPGPRALMASISPAENLGRLDFLLSRLSGYVGVVTAMGSRFTLAEDQMRPVLQALNRRGLMFVDAFTASDTVGPRLSAEFELPAAFVDVSLDDNPSRASIRRQLDSLESAARERGAAVALARPYPISIAAIAEWSSTLKTRAVKLVPASAVAGKQRAR